ncbi:Uncharacterized protein C1orf112 [Lonchura striata]|uniref:Uncharacterized protein C1orf112 n=1 Tax=Lonchura striata TaxID=40157 RepID=A0A218V4H4_9PASE|nr:Uncharacterized protein C1orf112 [Lonchura striata domestica]
MSRADPALLLRELHGWDGELCRRQLPAVLPRLLSMYEESEDWTEHIRILKILTEMFLPHISLEDVEQVFFSKVLPKTLQFFDNLMCELSSKAKGLTSQSTELCSTVRNLLQARVCDVQFSSQAVVQLLETLTGCVRYMCSVQELSLQSIRSLPSSVLCVVKSTFTHCKDSESVYNGHLHLISDLLQSMFKETYSLQKQLMELVDLISLDSASSEDDITLIHTVLEICSVISNMDHALHANTWKFIIKQSLKHHSLLQCHLKHSDILSGLCKDILLSFDSCLQLAEQMKVSEIQEGTDFRLFQKTVKLCRFFANSLVHYTKEFLAFLTDSCSQLHQLFLQIHSKFPPSLYAPEILEDHQDEISQVFLVALDPLITQLLPFSPFVEQVLSENLATAPMSPPAYHNGQAVLAARRSANSLEHRKKVVSTGQPAVPITLYHYVCVHLCSFIASTPPSHFPQLERALLDAVLGSSMITSLLAMDSWCFLARYGTAELCAHHVNVIAHLVKAWPSDCCQVPALGVLLRRMLFLMAPEHQASTAPASARVSRRDLNQWPVFKYSLSVLERLAETVSCDCICDIYECSPNIRCQEEYSITFCFQVEFAREFPPEEVENLAVWQHVSLRALNPGLRAQVASQLCSAGLARCQQWLSSSRALGGLPPVNTALSVLLAACNSADATLEAEFKTSILEVLSQFWSFLQVKQVREFAAPAVEACLGEAAAVSSVCLMGLCWDLSPAGLCTAVSPAPAACPGSLPPSNGAFSVFHGKGVYSTRSTGTDGCFFLLQRQVVPQLSCLFASLLADQTWLIHQHALEAFTHFAEVSRAQPWTRQVEETREARTERLKQERITWSAQVLKVDGELESTGEPVAKRACHPPSEEQYKAAVGTMEGAVEAVKLLLQKGSPPGWLAVKLEALHTAIATLRDSLW